MVRLCFKLKFVEFRGQTHFAPEIFKMSYLRNYKKTNVFTFSPLMANHHNLWKLQNK